MKAKVSFDSQKLKQFFAAHAEKIAFFVFLVIFGVMCYSAFGVKRFTLVQGMNGRLEIGNPNSQENRVPVTPEMLASDVKQTTERVVSPERWKAEEHDVQIPKTPFAVQAEAAMKPIDAPQYALAVPLNPPISDNRARRDDPKYLAARDVRATYGFGAVRLKNEGHIGKQWAMVTALVPVGDQTAEYQQKFQAALFTDKKKDVPEYLEFEIERAEVTSPGQAPTWTKLDVPAVWKDIDDKYGEFVEVVDTKYLDTAALTFRLPGLAGAEYDTSVAHPDEIPFGAKTDAPKAAVAAVPAPGAAAVGAAGAAAGAAPAAAAPARRRGARGPAAEEKGEKAAEVAADAVRFKLLRFIDYSVENVKTYQYRVKLILANPNYEVQLQFLKNPGLATDPEKLTDWSSPSKPMTTPRDNRLLAGSVKAASGANEAKATLVLEQWAPEHATVAKQLFEVSRGEFLNFNKDDTTVQVPGTAKVKKGPVHFRTNSLLLDMTGGESLTVPNTTRSVKAAAEVLVMGPDGTLTIRTQATDAADFAKGKAESAATVGEEPVAGAEGGVGEVLGGQPGQTAPAPKAGSKADPFQLPK